jgi:hypothetical protein
LHALAANMSSSKKKYNRSRATTAPISSSSGGGGGDLGFGSRSCSVSRATMTDLSGKQRAELQDGQFENDL